MFKKIYFYLITIIFCGFIGLVIVASIPDNPLRVENKEYSFVNIFLPQGWAFFTRSPDNYRLKIFRLKDNTLIHLNNRNSQIKQYFGVKKDNRLFPHFLRQRLHSIQSKFWYKSLKSANNIILDSINSFNIKTPDRLLFLGIQNKKYLCVYEKPKPWFYFSKSKVYNSPKYYVIINIK